MTLAPWRSPLARALHRNRSLRYSRYLQLATIRADGRPANRTVVFRGFLGYTDQIKFVTDARSEKAAQIGNQPWGEACWYFPKTREQFRIAGQLKLIEPHHPDILLIAARKTAWQELSDTARLQFAWPPPGRTRADDDAFAPPAPATGEPLPHFCLLLLQPETVDHLDLGGDRQNRWLYMSDSDEAWSTQAINP